MEKPLRKSGDLLETSELVVCFPFLFKFMFKTSLLHMSPLFPMDPFQPARSLPQTFPHCSLCPWVMHVCVRGLWLGISHCFAFLTT